MNWHSLESDDNNQNLVFIALIYMIKPDVHVALPDCYTQFSSLLHSSENWCTQ